MDQLIDRLKQNTSAVENSFKAMVAACAVHEEAVKNLNKAQEEFDDIVKSAHYEFSAIDSAWCINNI